MNINRESADANDHNLQLFKQWGELSLQDKLRLTAALRAAPRFEMVEIEEEEGEVYSMDQGHRRNALSWQL